ncbi:MAG TPA: hypothetical protein VGK10_18025 [Prolixibacteraceae bacterium]|jgi:hypothetical protein
MQKFRRLGVLLFLIVLFLFQLTAAGQNKKSFVITGKIVPEVQSSGIGSIEISKSGGETTKVEVPKSGRFRLELEYFNEFTLVFSIPGNFSKTIIVSTDIPQEVWKRDNAFPPFPMVVQLFREVEGIDKSFSLKPSGKIFYGKQTDNFEKEIIFNDIQIAEQIANAKLQSSQVKKEVHTITKTEAQDLATRQKNFDQSVSEADVFFKRGEYPAALLKYQDAQKLFPEKAYPNDRIAEIQDLVKALEITDKQKTELEQKYKSAIARANGLFERKTYKESRTGYEEALQYKPGDDYANGRIQEIDRLLALVEKQKQFDDLIAKADNNYQSKKLDQAAELYNQAKLLIPENEYPQNQINLINQEKQQAASLEQQEKAFTQSIENGDKLAKLKDYIQAISSYQKALELKPGNKLATEKIAATEQAIVIIGTDKKYQETLQQADQALAANDFQKSKMLYMEALKLKSAEAYPSSQISKIDKILDDKAKLEQAETEFLALVGKGDAAFEQKDYQGAKINYSSALTMKPTSAEVKSKIKNIETILNQLAENQKKENDRLQALAAANEKAYTDAIAKGNNQIEQKTYSDARVTFQEAKKLKPAEQLPDQMIARIDSLIAGNEREQAAARQKEEAYQKSIRDAQENSFNEAMTKADQAFTENDFNTAKTGYQTALAIKGTDPVAKEKLGQTEAKLAQLAKLTQSYNLAINAANKQVGDKKYQEAKEKYQEALQYLPDSDYPKRQIEKLDQLLTQAGAERQREELYAAKVKEAEALLSNKEYPTARSAFVLASEIKPSEPLPVRRIKEIDKLLADLALLDTKNKATQSAYMESIKRADQAFTDKAYTPSRMLYNEALSILPNEQYPKTRIAEIDQLMGDLKDQQYAQAIAAGDVAFKSDLLDEATVQYEIALTTKANDPYAKKQLGEITKRRAALLAEKERLKKLDAQYESLMADANNNFTNKEYQKAKEKYQGALLVKPGEVVPKDQIAKIDLLMKELAGAEEINRLYAQSVKSAEQAFGQNKLKEARDAYQQAHDYKPSEPMPPQRIAELDAMIAQLEETARLSAMEEAQRLAKEKANKEAYDKAIFIADQSLTEQQYVDARTNYSNALGILPNEKYPKDQINKIDGLIAQQEQIKQLARQQDMKDSLQKVKEQADKLAIKTEPVVTAPVVNAAETEKAAAARAQSYQTVSNYDEAISKADDSFGVKNYTVARFFYYKASELKPTEEYPKNQIELIRKLVESELSSVDRSGYQQVITQADEAFMKKSYSVAKFFYYKALGIKSWEQYPKDQIHEILRLTNSLLSEKEEKEYQDLITMADEAFTMKDISVARFYYTRAIVIKKSEDYPRTRIKDIQKLMDQDKLDVRDVEYNKLIELADQAMQSENYSIARFNYTKALNMKPEEKYPNDQLKRIKESLDKQKK